MTSPQHLPSRQQSLRLCSWTAILAAFVSVVAAGSTATATTALAASALHEGASPISSSRRVGSLRASVIFPLEEGYSVHTHTEAETLSNAKEIQQAHKRAQQAAANAGANGNDSEVFPLAIFRTPVGNITMRLRPDAAPLTVANFIHLIESGFYNNGTWPNNNGNGTNFYRYEKGFVLQGGNMDWPSTSTVPLEYNLPNAAWTVGLARDSDPNSGSSEFFINMADNSNKLCPPNAYAVFAEVIGGVTGPIRLLTKFPVRKEDGITFFQSPMPAILGAQVIHPAEVAAFMRNLE